MSWVEKYVDLSAGSNGSGTSGSPWNTWGNAVTGLGTVSVPTRVNVKGAQTTSGDVTVNPAGTSAGVPVWWRGYNTAIGDCDANFALTRPKTTVTSGSRFNVTTGYQVFTSIDIAGNYQFTGLVRITDGPTTWRRVKSVNSNSSAATAAAIYNASGLVIVMHLCEFNANAVASGCIDISGGGGTVVHGCECNGGISGIHADLGGNSGGLIAMDNILINGAGYGILVAGTAFLRQFVAYKNTIYNPGVDGIRFVNAVPSTAPIFIHGNVISTTTSGYGIKSTDSTACGSYSIGSNLFHSINQNKYAGLIDDAATGDGSAFNTLTDSSSPFTNAAGGDFSLAATSSGRAAMNPGVFGPGTTTGYGDVGAGQHQDAGGGGGSNTYSRGRIVNGG